MKIPLRNPGLAALLSFILPGLGQTLGGKPGRGIIITLPAIALFFVFLPAYLFANKSLIGSSGGLTSLLVIDAIACVYHVWAVVDAYREIKPPFVQAGMRGVEGRRPTIALEFAALIGLVAATIGVHAALGFVDYNSCTMRGRSCAQPAAAAIAAASQKPGASPTSHGSGQASSPGPSAVPTPQPIATPATGQTIVWKPIADRLRVHSSPASDSPSLIVLRQTQTVTGQLVTGSPYSFAGGLHTEWIKIDADQPGAGGYVAAAYYYQAGFTTAPATPTPTLGPSSPSPDGTPSSFQG